MQKRTQGQGSDFRTGDRVCHYTKPVVNGSGKVVEFGMTFSTVRWDNGIERRVPNVNLRKAPR
jgi:hypothetical protein